MKRDLIQTVTMPILVEASEGIEPDDRGTFLPANWSGSALVHVVTEQDVMTWFTHDLSEKDQEIFIGLSHLKVGLEEEDEYTLTKGHERLRPLVKDLASIAEWTVQIRENISIGSGGGQKWNASIENYSGLVTKALKNSRFVVWGAFEKYGRFVPALYCKDKKTAVFAMRLVGSLRVCPKCDSPFIPSAGNMDYCKSAHGAAHRVARSRWNKKRKQSLQAV